jgi:hypothetical protein
MRTNETGEGSVGKMGLTENNWKGYSALTTFRQLGYNGRQYCIIHLHYLWKRSISINRPARLEYVGYGIMLFLIMTNSGSPTKFVYFQS